MVPVNPTEQAFVDAFVRRKRRASAILELEPARRRRFLSRLCHDYAGLLDPSYLRSVSPAGTEDLLDALKERGAPGMAYVISANEDVDGRQLPLENAVRALFGYGLPSIVICEPRSLAYFEAEQEAGPPPRYLLTR